MIGRALGALLGALGLLGAACASSPDGQMSARSGVANEALRGAVMDRPKSAGRILTRTAELRVDVDDVGKALEAVHSIAVEVGGYVERAQQAEREHASMTLRIPGAELDAVLARLSGLGRETYRVVGSEDVTEQYVDLESRIKNAIQLRDRLRELLTLAKAVKDVLAVEVELGRVQSELESMQAQFDHLKRRVDLASVHLSLDQKRIYGPLGYVFKGIEWVVTKLFVIR